MAVCWSRPGWIRGLLVQASLCSRDNYLHSDVRRISNSSSLLRIWLITVFSLFIFLWLAPIKNHQRVTFNSTLSKEADRSMLRTPFVTKVQGRNAHEREVHVKRRRRSKEYGKAGTVINNKTPSLARQQRKITGLLTLSGLFTHKHILGHDWVMFISRHFNWFSAFGPRLRVELPCLTHLRCFRNRPRTRSLYFFARTHSSTTDPQIA